MSEFKELGRLLSNVLISNGIETKAQLVEIMSNNPADIIKLPGVGKMSLAKISNWISGDPIKSMQAEIERLKAENAQLNNACAFVKTVFDVNLGSGGYVPTFGKLATDDCITHLNNALNLRNKEG